MFPAVTSRRLVAVLSAGLLGLTFATAPAASADEEVGTASHSPLEGKVILLDPGHQLGNSNPKFAKPMARKKFNGTSLKGCNTTGTATNSGFPEATFNWRVANKLKKQLEQAGAKVALTRDQNSYDAWGPCVWNRAKQANRIDADIMINIHADGSSAKNRGFFVLAPGLVPGWTEDVVKPGRTLARSMICGMTEAGAPPANYIRNQLMITKNTTGLNFSNVPSVTVELGNMRNKSDARRMESSKGQQDYARWLQAGIEAYFTRSCS